ncbi:MAG TPA: MarP family serine protease [Acidimicrobiales bacterium]|nr:MarP family serine protease [Acidimicrobiales bacterium]
MDIVLLVFVVLAAIHGLRLGAVMQVLSFGGFWIGLVIGAVLAPPLTRLVTSPTSKALVATVVLFGCAGIFGGFGRVLGARSSRVVRRLRLGPLDSGLGVAVGVVATLLACWLVAELFVQSSATWLDADIQGSRIIRTMNSILPDPPAIFSRIRSFLAAEGFPVVFAGIPPSTAGPVPVPSDVMAEADVAGPSTLKVVGEGCGVIQEGSAFVVAPGVLVTNAHVVAGIPRPQVLDSSGVPHPVAVVLFDPELDVAVLRVAGISAPPLNLDPQMVGRGTAGAALGYPNGGPLDVQPAGLMASFDATGLDIYGRNQTSRQVYELDATIRPGNSGGPFVEPNGTVVGVVFARSTTDPTVGYALASPAVLAEVHTGESATHTVGTGPCTD